MTFRNHFKLLAATVAVASMTSTAAFAGFNQGNSVTFNGQPVFKIDSAAEGFSPERRAWQSQDALDNALFLTQSPTPDSVEVARQNGAFVLKVGGHYIATADENSAKAEGLSPETLAFKWADSLKDALSNSSKNESYIASLKTPNELEGSKIKFERRVFAPQGTVLPVAFNENLNPAYLTPGQCITGKITSNVPLGNYFIPANSVLLGNVIESQPGAYTVKISRLCTPAGTEVPVNAVLTSNACMISTAPHPVATIGIPANSVTDTRVPALIGIGTGAGTQTAMILSRDNGCSIACGQPANVVLEKVSSVAVIPGSNPM